MKRYIKNIVSLCLLPLLLASCLNDDFLEESPRTSFTPDNAFVTYDNFKTYAWGLYGYSEFDRYPLGGNDTTRTSFGTPDDPNVFSFDYWAGFMIKNSGNGESPWAFQNVTESGMSGDWNYEFIRKVNVMLDNIDKSTLSTEDKEHWRSVGYFFRSMRYFKMMSSFGDIIWEEHEVKTTDIDVLYAARTPRDQVAQKILDNLKYAETHIKADGDGPNTINVNVVRALISRFGLFEGTWRKYHGLSSAETYLQASFDASTKLMQVYTTLHPNYNEEFNSVSLSGVPGIILYKPYVKDMYQNLTRYARTASIAYELTQTAVNMYLCTDGTVITKSRPNDVKDIYQEFMNRDKRLLWVTCPPYRIKSVQANTYDADKYTRWAVGDVIPTGTSKVLKVETQADADRLSYFIDYFNTPGYTQKNQKWLPIANWQENLVKSMPHFKSYSEGQGFLASTGGFMTWRFYNRHVTPTVNGVNEEDAPIFRLAEVLVNHAEVAYELGQFNQNVADATINNLRARAGVAPMVVANITPDFDPDRDPFVAPVLWEIRRERRVELMADGFGFDDIRRWKVAPFYIDKRTLGAWVDNADYGNSLAIYAGTEPVSTTNSANKSGNVAWPVNAPKGWLDYYYLYPLPMDELSKNKNLTQNPGYQSPAN